MTFNKPKHCWHCEHFHATVFEGETEHGMGSWDGYCAISDMSGRLETKGRYLACEAAELSEEQRRKDEPFNCAVCGKTIRRIERLTNGDAGVCSMECARDWDVKNSKVVKPNE